ncbi:DUF1156 domain-containing protein [Natronogracilivirgula saccharolytica]|uniref:DUF1156 domain-containing protein n=2 Tax=Natronogracilivirga saccharolytica TaxID=2812953 RepID=A0A8J7UWA9_9BACT|nr:DUF1156 domain-containing protein [Natronogracilivirga saccharolytica]
MPIREVSVESVRDKSIRHGHISTLHLWWARRPLPVCRAVVFASLVPDPLDPECPKAFRKAVDAILGRSVSGDPYRPYENIPWTVVDDPMEDNLRNRLMMFIGKFSDRFIQNERVGKNTPVKDQISEYSLIKWESRHNKEVLHRARKLIWVAYHSGSSHEDADALLTEYEQYWNKIEEAESRYYTLIDRDRETPKVQDAKLAVDEAIAAFQNRMPSVFDPFAGGGAIPLEAARLGCRSYGNDLNPVAHIIQRGSVEFPQKFGKPIRFSRERFITRYGKEAWRNLPQEDLLYENGGDATGVYIANRLAFDVDFYARKLLKMAEEEIGHFYPEDEHGKKPIAYYWARTARCANPSCRAEVPLLKQFYLCKKKDKKVYLKPIVEEKSIRFRIEYGTSNDEAWVEGNSLRCPCCGNITPIKQIKEQSQKTGLGLWQIAVIENSSSGKRYRLPNEEELKLAKHEVIQKLDESLIPQEDMIITPDMVSGRGWGITKWKDLFSPRQLLAIQTLIQKHSEIKQELFADVNDDYAQSVVTYLAILIDRIVAIQTSFGRWHVGRETLEHPFARQAIPMIFDYPEANIFSSTTGGFKNQLFWIVTYIDSESWNHFHSVCNNSSSGDINQFPHKSITATVTDPPYYDAIAYADISDFFYVWMKRTLADMYPLNFATPQTPKTEECTALKHHHSGEVKKAYQHFENKLKNIFSAIEHQTSDIVSIMFAHQSTKAWTTLCNSILGANMNITGSWAIDTEMANRSVSIAGAALASSVTVSCRPTKKSGFASFQEVRTAVTEVIRKEVKELYDMGFRGADLLTACFGQAVSVFGAYEHVEKNDGSEVKVSELLALARDAAFQAIISDIEADEYTRFYIGWCNLFGFTETQHDEVRRVTQIGLSLDVSDLEQHHILQKSGNSQQLMPLEDRIQYNPKLGTNKSEWMLNHIHRAMYLFNKGNRDMLISHLHTIGATNGSSFWRVLTSLSEVLPGGTDDFKAASELMANQKNLVREALNYQARQGEQSQLDL